MNLLKKPMKKIFIFLAFLVSHFALAQNIVVLTSLSADEFKTTFRLNKIAKKKLSHFNDLNLIIKNNVDQETLYHYLNSPLTTAVFWISHGAYIKEASNSRTMGAKPMLLDFKKDNIAEIFKLIHPNISYIGVIGCNSSQILNEEQSLSDERMSYLPKRKVIATLGFKRAIRKFKKNYYQIAKPPIRSPIINEGFKIKISRITKNDAKSLKILNGDKLLGLLPKSKAHTLQAVEVYIKEKKNLKIVLSSGQSAFDSEDNFGKITLSHNGNSSLWKLFAKPNGEAFGVNERIFLFKGDSQDIEQKEEFIEFNN